MRKLTLFEAFLLCFAVVCIVLLLVPAWASGPDVEQNVDTNTTVKGSHSLGVGGADYDLAAGTCRVHHGGFTVAIATFDEYCQGIGLIDRGMVKAGIRHICKQSPVGKNYAGYNDCEAELLDVFAVPEPVPALESISDAEDEYEEQLAQQIELYEALSAKVEMLEQVKRPTTINRTVQQPFLSEEKRKALAEVVK